MAVQEEVAGTLTKLGLTVSEAKVYFALCTLGKATGKTISTHLKMARSEVYRVLAKLREKGLVEKIITMPTEFKPISIENCLHILIERQKNQISETQKKAINLLQKLKKTTAEATLQEEETQYILIPEREAVVLRTKKALENAQTSMDSIISWKKFSYLMFHARKFGLKKALKRDVKLRFITEKPEDEEQLPKIVEAFKKNFFFKVKYVLAAPLTHIGLFDKKEVFINTSTTGGLTETPLLWSNNSCLVAVVQDYFEIAWIWALESNYLHPKKLGK